MKSYVRFKDDIFEEVLTFEQLKEVHDGYFYDVAYDKIFGTEKSIGWKAFQRPMYVEYYEFDGDYTAQELEDILSRMKNGHEIHLMNVIGKVEKI